MQNAVAGLGVSCVKFYPLGVVVVSNVARDVNLVLPFKDHQEFINRLKGNEMSETQQGSSISNLTGVVVIVVILALTGVIVYQQSQLTNAVMAAATIAGKCAK